MTAARTGGPVHAAAPPHQSHWLEGAVLGGALGAVIGVLSSHPNHLEFGGLTAAFALSGALLGALIGLMISG